MNISPPKSMTKSMTISFGSNVYDLERMMDEIPSYVINLAVEGKKTYSLINLNILHKHEGNILMWCQNYFNPIEHRDLFRVPTRDLIFSFSNEAEKEKIIANRFSIVGVCKAWSYTVGVETLTFHVPY